MTHAPIEPRETADVVFLDTETLGTRLTSPIWEVAAIRRSTSTGEESRLHMFVHHTIHPFYDELPETFQRDYDQRFDAFAAVTQAAAGARIYEFFAPDSSGCKPIVVGRVPSFDAIRIHYQLLTPSRGLCLDDDLAAPEPWDFHLADISNLVVGYLRGMRAVNRAYREAPADFAADLSTRSDTIAAAIGVKAADYARHTAMGDCEWVKAQYDVISGTGGLVGWLP
nr:hypothetical protein [Mycobacterium sp. UM_NZ2]